MTTAVLQLQARALLGVGPLAGQRELRQAFARAAKRAHPDREGGDAALFREVLAAYRLLVEAGISEAAPQASVVAAALEINALMALTGGVAEARLADGRLIALQLPPGLRHGERLRLPEAEITIAISRDGETVVRGDDLWTTALVDVAVLREGGRTAVDTPVGRRIVWVTRKAAERGLVRLEGQGLPARAGYAQGSLFLRLAADETPAEGPARTQLKRFAAAWAA